mmetsp:Transcript_39635/g.78044  ORF Transcript_39635/g.78044 Transcript_39635/m.78044 type:complete len:584 (+) Transcript_39635:612-2363(+)
MNSDFATPSTKEKTQHCQRRGGSSVSTSLLFPPPSGLNMNKSDDTNRLVLALHRLSVALGGGSDGVSDNLLHGVALAVGSLSALGALEVGVLVGDASAHTALSTDEVLGAHGESIGGVSGNALLAIKLVSLLAHNHGLGLLVRSADQVLLVKVESVGAVVVDGVGLVGSGDGVAGDHALAILGELELLGAHRGGGLDVNGDAGRVLLVVSLGADLGGPGLVDLDAASLSVLIEAVGALGIPDLGLHAVSLLAHSGGLEAVGALEIGGDRNNGHALVAHKLEALVANGGGLGLVDLVAVALLIGVSVALEGNGLSLLEGSSLDHHLGLTLIVLGKVVSLLAHHGGLLVDLSQAGTLAIEVSAVGALGLGGSHISLHAGALGEDTSFADGTLGLVHVALVAVELPSLVADVVDTDLSLKDALLVVVHVPLGAGVVGVLVHGLDDLGLTADKAVILHHHTLVAGGLNLSEDLSDASVAVEVRALGADVGRLSLGGGGAESLAGHLVGVGARDLRLSSLVVGAPGSAVLRAIRAVGLRRDLHLLHAGTAVLGHGGRGIVSLASGRSNSCHSGNAGDLENSLHLCSIR